MDLRVVRGELYRKMRRKFHTKEMTCSMALRVWRSYFWPLPSTIDIASPKHQFYSRLRDPSSCQMQNIHYWWAYFSFLLAPIFGFKKHATPSKPTVELVPPMVAEEDNVLFLVRNLPEKLQGFAWHKGVLPLDHFKIASHAILINSSMLAHKYYGRATIYTNGSLLLQNVTQKDTGIYTLRTISADLRSEWAIMHLQVNSKWFFVTPGW